MLDKIILKSFEFHQNMSTKSFFRLIFIYP